VRAARRRRPSDGRWGDVSSISTEPPGGQRAAASLGTSRRFGSRELRFSPLDPFRTGYDRHGLPVYGLSLLVHRI
jgi:hypothetical protein